ncbi:MAG: hypothetical protein DRP74_06525 [Candidatus Omnitrophota bacterium]|nr:MAG: hypothetical protein DRP74_06525 [Candidatus Omnitrophota bacterium]
MFNKNSLNPESLIKYVETLVILVQELVEQGNVALQCGRIPITQVYLLELVTIHLIELFKGNALLMQKYRKVLDQYIETYLTVLESSKLDSGTGKSQSNFSTLFKKNQEKKTEFSDLLKELKELPPDKLKSLLSHFYDQILDLYLEKKKKKGKEKK